MSRYYKLGVRLKTKPSYYHVGADSPVSQPSQVVSVRDGAWAEVRRELAKRDVPGYIPFRWLGYQVTKDGKQASVVSNEESTIADWYGKAADDPSIAYATYFDLNSKNIEPIEEYGGTVDVRTMTDPPPVGKIKEEQGSGTKVAAGIALGVLSLIAIAKKK